MGGCISVKVSEVVTEQEEPVCKKHFAVGRVIGQGGFGKVRRGA
jgi:hypothetical protein